MLGTSYSNKQINGFLPVGTYLNSDSDLVTIKMKIKANAKIYFQSGPKNYGKSSYKLSTKDMSFSGFLPNCEDWCVLSFDIINDESILEIRDYGVGYGEWIAVGYKPSI